MFLEESPEHQQWRGRAPVALAPVAFAPVALAPVASGTLWAPR
jgi:hypothetical protein